jgi:uracil-DNA glycosylase family 4
LETTKVVQNIVNPDAEIAVLGLAPGETETAQNMPFIGKAGQRLKDALLKAGVELSGISYLNSALCWPPDNKLNMAIINACKPYFQESLSLMPKLKAILILGGEAYKFVTGTNKTVMKDLYLKSFRLKEYGDILFIPNYHPSSILYNPSPDQVALFYNGIKQSIEMYKALKEVSKPVHSFLTKNEQDLKRVLEYISSQSLIAFDTEFTSLKHPISQLLTMHFSTEENTAIGIPYRYWNGKELVYFFSHESNLFIANKLKEIFSNPRIGIAGQNLKCDSIMMRKEFGFRISNVRFDCQAASFLLDSSLGTSMEDMLARELPERAGRKTKFWGDIEKNGWYKHFSLDEILSYGNDDAMDTFKLANVLAAKL